ncbi:PEP-CTERM sorting domain-containing protein [Haloferula sp.]|uniref:PEP-CTERM sorting domain-containing protein n=1 Tax=Haloferula sp. TaxID=2497595 RepID=UPI0032A06646
MDKSIIIGIAAIVAAGAAQAATISWETAQNIAGDSDVSLSGTSVYAYSYGGTDETVNTQEFIGMDGSPGGNADIGLTFDRDGNPDTFAGTTTPFTSLTTGYQSLVGSSSWGRQVLTGTVTLNGLIIDQAYSVQIWMNDSRDRTDWNIRTSTLDGAAVDHNTTDAHGGLGQYIIGTFTADAASQDIAVVSLTAPQIAAIQLRAVPEPSSAALLGLGGLALVLRRRK